MNKLSRLLKIVLSLTLLVLTTGSTVFSQEPEAEYDFSYEDETIFTDTVWSGTVFINGVVTVYEDITLTIEPGTVIMFKKKDTTENGFGENEMYIRGEIVAEGTPEKPITFTSAEKVKQPGDWIAINMMVSEEKRNIFKHCIVEYSLHGFHAHYSEMKLINCEVRENLLGIQFQDSTVTITDCNVHDNNQAIQFRDAKLKISGTKIINNNIGIRSVYSEIEFTDNIIKGCSMVGYQVRGSKVNISGSRFENSKAGIAAQDSTINITGSYVLDNMQDGLSLHNSDVTITKSYIMLNSDDGILLENCTAVINSNNIYNNAKYNMTLEQPGDVDAKNNYWGTDNVNRIDYFNYDKKNDNSLGTIIYDGYTKTEINITK